MIIKPNKIKEGDTISIIAPAGNIEKDKILNSVKYFENLGFKIKLGENIFNQDRYMAGTDKQRLDDLHNAFSDKDINAIFCARGGYGAIRLINKIDYDLIKSNPKIFCGYSDITALSIMFLKKSNLLTFSSPMPKGDFQQDNLDTFTVQNFWKTITNSHLTITPEEIITYNTGNAHGIIWGGNLATISSLCGLDFIPDEQFIFFAEDINEPVYKIDRYFRQLFNISKFRQNVTAVILGEFTCINEYEDQLESLFYEIANEFNIPVYGGYRITHLSAKLTIPIGGYCEIDNGTLNIDY